MKKREQHFTTECKKWCLKNLNNLKIGEHETLLVECKVSVDNKPFNLKSGFKPHQLPGLISTQNTPYGYKPSDAAMTQQLCDLIIINKSKSYVAIHWVRRGNKIFYLIDPVSMQGYIDDGYKSLTEDMAKMICDIKGELK